MNRPVRTGTPVLVTSRTSTTPRARHDLDPPAGLGRHDLERLDALPGVDHRLDSIALHGGILVLSRHPFRAR